MTITSRQELKDYCLRRLGFPVIEINVDDDQVEDRVQDALDYWNEYHFDGIERIYLKSQVEASVLKLSTSFAQNFTVGEVITGTTSKATAEIYSKEGVNQLKIRHVSGTFANSETVTGAKSGFATTTHASTAYTEKNWTSGKFQVADSVTGVIKVFSVGTAGASRSSTNIFDAVYQFRLNDMYNLLSSDIIYYQQVKMQLQLLDDMFAGDRDIRFNRKQNFISIDVDMNTVFVDGDYVIFEVYRALDPEEWKRVYNDMFLRRYATALIKRQWGDNMKKFGGMQLPGGVTLNGQIIYDEAMQEIDKIEEEMQLRYSLPVDFMVG
jgi:hypothetical protein